jgi:type IX secretion system PorP/SprF family membrane protein
MKLKFTLFFLVITCCTSYLYAQEAGSSVSIFNPPVSQYFFNQYLANPAMAGIDSGVHINLSYQKPFNSAPGAPVTQTGSLDANMGYRIGLGLNVYNDKAGLLQRTKIGATYAYHLPLSSNSSSSLHFGLTLAMQIQRLDTKELNGDPNDPAVADFNRRANYFESDFGMAYTNKAFTLQASMPNLVSRFRKDQKNLAGIPTFFTSASYKFDLGEDITMVEPKICYRGVSEMDNIIDAGVNVGFFRNWVNVFGMYQSSGNINAGAGINYKTFGGIQFVYASQTKGYSNIMGNTFEIDLRINIGQ